MEEISPIIAFFISDELIGRVKANMLWEIEKRIPGLFDRLKSEIGENYDIHSIVEEKIANFSLEKLEDIILAVSKRELRQIERLGGFIGFFLAEGGPYIFIH